MSGLSSVGTDDGHQVAPIVLRRAITSGKESRRLWHWHQQATREDKGARHDVVIELLDEHQEAVVARWQLTGAWPSRWTGPTFDASGNDVAMEEIELTCEQIEWTD